MRLTRTKIVATVGPASGSPEAIQRMVATGVDVFRLNFSHGDYESHEGYIKAIRRASAEAGTPAAVMQDLQGPRIRTGALRGEGPVELEEGAEVILKVGDFQGDGRCIPVSYEPLARDVGEGDSIILSDGLIELRALEASAEDRQVRCRVRTGGKLQQNQGMNLPGVKLSLSAPTPKDLEDLAFGVEQGVDLVALSFVQNAQDVLDLKDALAEHGREAGEIPVIAKIEKPEAVENLDAILQVVDGVMVARGDLGIEMPTEAVPAAQKRIIRAANRMAMPVITATQMLESMVDSPRPSRAEASDVANAILDGTDAVMLSEETSVGRYPVRSVQVMDSIAREIEPLRGAEPGTAPPQMAEIGTDRELALAGAACRIGETLDAAGIVCFTITGNTARYVSQHRPDVPVYALTPRETTYRRLALVWAVRPIMLEVLESTDQMLQSAQDSLMEQGFAEEGDTLVYIAGASPKTPGGTNMLKIQQL